MAKKQRVSPVTPPPDIESLKGSFRTTGDLPTPAMVDESVAIVTTKIDKIEKTADKKTEKTVEKKTVQKAEKKIVKEVRNQRKRETAKGTQSFTVMIDKEIASEAKVKAVQTGMTFSDLVTKALVEYLRNT